MYKPDFSPNGDIQIGELATCEQDFKIMPTEEILRGQYFPESNRSYVYVGRHESIQEIIDTCTHETIHALIDQEDSENDDFRADITQEHWVIRHIMWANETLI